MMGFFNKAIKFVAIVIVIGLGSIFAYRPVTSLLKEFFPADVKVPVPQLSEADQNSISKFILDVSADSRAETPGGLPVVDLKDPDLNGLDMTFEKIREASIDNNLYLFEQWWSEPTRSAFVGSNEGKVLKPLKDMSFTNIRKINSLKVLVKVTTVEMSRHTESRDMIFVRETRGWRLGIVETEQYFAR